MEIIKETPMFSPLFYTRLLQRIVARILRNCGRRKKKRSEREKERNCTKRKKKKKNARYREDSSKLYTKLVKRGEGRFIRRVTIEIGPAYDRGRDTPVKSRSLYLARWRDTSVCVNCPSTSTPYSLDPSWCIFARRLDFRLISRIEEVECRLFGCRNARSRIHLQIPFRTNSTNWVKLDG